MYSPPGQMSLKADWFLASSSLHTSREDAAKDEFFSRKYTQPFCPHRPLRSLHADGYMTRLPENGKHKGKYFGNWPTLLSLTNESTVLSDDSLKKNSLNNVAARHDEQRTRNIDVTTFGNLCVDIVLNVPTLPPASFEEKLEYMENLARSSPDEVSAPLLLLNTLQWAILLSCWICFCSRNLLGEFCNRNSGRLEATPILQ